MTYVRGCRRKVATVVALVALLALPLSLAAQPPPRSTAAQEGFVPVDKLPQQEAMPAVPLVAGAYAIAWTVIFGYLLSIWRRLSTVERELDAVSRRLPGRPS